MLGVWGEVAALAAQMALPGPLVGTFPTAMLAASGAFHCRYQRLKVRFALHHGELEKQTPANGVLEGRAPLLLHRRLGTACGALPLAPTGPAGQVLLMWGYRPTMEQHLQRPDP